MPKPSESPDETIVLAAVPDETLTMPTVRDYPETARTAFWLQPPGHKPATADEPTAEPAAEQTAEPAVEQTAEQTAEPIVEPPPATASMTMSRLVLFIRARHQGIVLAAGAGALVLVGVLLLASVFGATTTSPRSASPTTLDSKTITAEASSTSPAEGLVSYGAANTLDADPKTAWNSNGRKDGDGPGISLTYTFASPVDLRSITLLNGYDKVRAGASPADLWQLNERIHRLTVITDAGQWSWELADSRAAQTLSQAFGHTRSVRLEIVSIYPSDRYRDVAVSEVSFTGV